MAVRELPLQRLPHTERPIRQSVQANRPTLIAVYQTASSHDRVASFLEDAEGSCAHGYKASITITDPGLDGGDATCAVDDLGGAGDPTLPHGTEEVDVEADGRCPQADERGHREPHRVVYERGVDPAVQRPVAVEVDALHVYVADGLPRLDLLDLAPYVPRESNLLVEVLSESGQLFFVQASYCFIITPSGLPLIYVSRIRIGYGFREPAHRVRLGARSEELHVNF